MTWIGWLDAYLVVGLLMGEGALAAMRRKGSPLNAPGYLILVLLWLPVVASVIIASLLKKRT